MQGKAVLISQTQTKSEQHSLTRGFLDLCRRHPVKATGAALVALQQPEVRVVPSVAGSACAGGLQGHTHSHSINANSQCPNECLMSLHSCICTAASVGG